MKKLFVKAFAGCSILASLVLLHACTVMPDPPRGLTVSNPTATSLTITWSASSGALGYELYRDTSAGGGFVKKVYDGEGTSHTDTGLAPDTVYWYKVLAKAIMGAGDLSTAVSGRTQTGIPATPTGFKTQIVSDIYIILQWDGMPDATGYELYWDPAMDGNFAEPALYDSSATSFQHDGLTTETDYYYKVRSKSSFGKSAFTAPLKVRTGTVPATVTIQ
jgi:chitodextrinase